MSKLNKTFCSNLNAFFVDFTGSAGTAVVTKDKAVVWTDSRYYLQAESQLNITYDKTWTLMKGCKKNLKLVFKKSLKD